MTLPDCRDLLPHARAAVLLERVVEVHAEGLTAAMTVRPGTAFSQPDGSLAAWAAPEIMAQAVSAFANLASRERRPAMGFLLGVRNLRILGNPFPAGSSLRVEVTESTRDPEGHGVFNCRVLREGGVVAEGKLTVFQPDDPLAVLGEQIS